MGPATLARHPPVGDAAQPVGTETTLVGMTIGVAAVAALTVLVTVEMGRIWGTGGVIRGTAVYLVAVASMAALAATVILVTLHVS